MTRVSCQGCGETSRINAERFLDDDGVRKVRVTCHQIVHAEPLETVMDDPDHSTLDTGSSATGQVFGDQVIVCTWNPTLADDLPDGMRQEAVDATRAGDVRRLQAHRPPRLRPRTHPPRRRRPTSPTTPDHRDRHR